MPLHFCYSAVISQLETGLFNIQMFLPMVLRYTCNRVREAPLWISATKRGVREMHLNIYVPKHLVTKIFASLWDPSLGKFLNCIGKTTFNILILILTQLPINGLINELINSSNYFINIQFIKYISACFDVRDKLLSK